MALTDLSLIQSVDKFNTKGSRWFCIVKVVTIYYFLSIYVHELTRWDIIVHVGEITCFGWSIADF